MLSFLKKKTKIPKSEFDSLSKDLCDQLFEWQRYTVECSFNYPMPSLELVLAVERSTKSIHPEMLKSIGRLDSRLELNGSLAKAAIELDKGITAFKASPDGPSFQILAKHVLKFNALLDRLGKNHTTPD